MGGMRLAALLAALLLGACALAPRGELPRLAAVPGAFEVSGRLAVRMADRSEIARLRWTHRPDSDLWVFASPLGNEVARIESGPTGATLAQGSAAPQQAASFAALTERLLGLALDPAELARWLHGGLPAGAVSDWQVTIEETQAAGAIEEARRISARRGEASVRLVVDEYRALGPAAP